MNQLFTKGLDNYQAPSAHKVVATIGTFDGIHQGHQAILSRLNEIAREEKAASVLITFDPHPREIVAPDSAPLLLTTLAEKKEFIPDFFSGQTLVLEFDRQLSQLSLEQFVVEILLKKIKVTKLVVGYDHALGKDRKGNIRELARVAKEHDLEIEVIGPVLADEKPVSSSRIRTALAADRFDEAINLLGHDYAIFGTVERGIGLGRKLGYPTANVGYDSRKLLPGEGVYVCKAWVRGERKHGMMFIGRNHFNPVEKISVEANLFDFDDDIYGEEIAVYPTRFLRGNRKFDSTDGLVEQIGIDKINTLEYIEKEKKNDDRQRAKSSNCC